VATGRIIGAQVAERYGLVHHVFASADFERLSREFAEDLARHSASAIALSKRLIYESERHSFEAAIRAGAEINVLARLTEDCRRGVREFLESKRVPRRKGKR
jgi:methylglutaconyl-CoA hydratase